MTSRSADSCRQGTPGSDQECGIRSIRRVMLISNGPFAPNLGLHLPLETGLEFSLICS